MMTMILRVLLFLVPVIAWAQPAPTSPVIATPLPDPVTDARTAQAASMLRQAQAALAAAQAAAQQAAMSAQPARAPEVVTIPAEVRDALLSLCSLLITAGIGVGLAWMRSHLAFMKEAGANAAITSSAQGLGALLEQALAKQGKSLSTVDISDPMIADAARKLIAGYPEWGPLVGLTQDIAERKVLGGAIQQSVAAIVPAPTVAVVPPAAAPAPIVASAGWTPPAPIVTSWIAPPLTASFAPQPVPVTEAAATPQQGSIA
jgi:hypothetical protein